MKLYYHRSALGNFGDDLNAWIWDDLLPGWRDWDPDRTLVGVGTLLSSTLIDRQGGSGRFLVAGTGVGYGTGAAPDISDRARWDVRSVRGPLSARSLGLPDATGVVDPAVMIATFPQFRNLSRTGRPAFVPHESTVERHDWTTACATLGLDFVSPRGEAKAVIARIATASAVLAESMHAAIIADAFRVPWIPVRIGHKFFARKWMDWAASLDIALEDIPPLFPLEERIFALPQAALASYRAYRRKASDPKPRPRVGASAPAAAPANVRLRAGVEATHLTGALRQQLNRPALLSDAGRLAARQDSYRAVLEGIRKDYA